MNRCHETAGISQSTSQSVVEDWGKLKMISSLYLVHSLCNVMFMHMKSLTQCNANQCYLLFVTRSVPYLWASLIFTAAKLFHQMIWERAKPLYSCVHNGGWDETLKSYILWSNFYPLFFECIVQNSMKELKNCLKFANICISYGDIYNWKMG